MKPPYEITSEILNLVISVSEKLGEINAAHLVKQDPVLRKTNRIKTIHSTLEIEGNTLSIDQITAIFENKRVLGPKKEILEVKNAIEVYDIIEMLNPRSKTDFLKAHKYLMNGLVDDFGKFRKDGVGILKGNKLAHMAPPPNMVNELMTNLFAYLKTNKDSVLIKSCVFHYEMEFIHPFLDGNGRMGRLWQSIILGSDYPVFKYLPIESVVKEKQAEYYDVLSKCDKSGKSTLFIEFMLEIINGELEKVLKATQPSIKQNDRIEIAHSKFNDLEFSRKDYLREFKEISPATASRDLKEAVDQGLLNKTGDQRTAKYSFIATN